VSNIAPLLDRNRAFASDPSARQDMPRLPFIPNLNLYIVTCIDCQVDPAQVLGVKLGEALVQRNIGGRITPAIIADIAYAGYLVDTKAPEGPYFEVAIVHHTDCGDPAERPRLRARLRRRHRPGHHCRRREKQEVRGRGSLIALADRTSPWSSKGRS